VITKVNLISHGGGGKNALPSWSFIRFKGGSMADTDHVKVVISQCLLKNVW